MPISGAVRFDMCVLRNYR